MFNLQKDYNYIIKMFYDKYHLELYDDYVLFIDINDVPQIVNLGLADAIAVHEGTPLGTTVYAIQYVDLDSTDTHAFHVTYDQTWAANYFGINQTSLYNKRHYINL